MILHCAEQWSLLPASLTTHGHAEMHDEVLMQHTKGAGSFPIPSVKNEISQGDCKC